MNELESAALLERARRGFSPSAGDAERVRHAVTLAVQGELPANAGTRASARPEQLSPTGISAVMKLGLALALAGAAGVGGYALGFRAGRAESEASRARAQASVVVVAPAPTSNSAPAAPLLSVAPEARELTRAPRGARSASPSLLAPPPASSSESPLEIETRLLARVERALRDDNPRLALGLLGELDRTVPGGQLAEERHAGRVVAHCQLGSDSAAELARDFETRYRASAYLLRVTEACGAAAATAPAPE